MRSALALALLASCILPPTSDAQTVQYRSDAGVVFRSDPDTGAIARAAAALAADPRNVDKVIALGVAQAGRTQMREAIVTFANGIIHAPNNALLYRWRGHRHLSVREFDLAMNDFAKSLSLDSATYGSWYHMGIIKFARGDYAGAAAAFRRAQPIAPDPGELAGSVDWWWMSLMRAGKPAEAKAMLDRKLDSLPIDNAYTQRLKLYRGTITPDRMFTAAGDTVGTQGATLAYGVGNWYLVKGDTAKAKEYFQRAIRSGGWAAFGFIVSEIELKRLK
jgi:tetratricopeptide (TPR) repeat protein